jgi:glutamine cyclotransferase
MSAIVTMKRAVKSTIRAISRWRIPRAEPIIVRTLPHDRTSFTQGLAHANGTLYESSGDHQRSKLCSIDLGMGHVQKTVSIPNDFAEGIAIYDNRLYQLSWKSERALVFRLPDLELIDELRYDGEGWGLANGPAGMVMSNGTGTLRFVDSAFRTTGELRVTLNRLPTRRLNDLEWVGDAIYANVLWSNEILEISARHGRVKRIIDCSALVAKAATDEVEHTLNGIAYNSDRRTFFVTGKCWPLTFEVQFPSSDPASD